MTLRRIDDSISVASQIAVADVAGIAEAGFATIVNNRPDGEDPSEPQGDAIRAAAQAAGLAYAYIPVTHAGFSSAQIEAMVAAMDESDGPVLAYCRSGTRSTHLWALAAASQGGHPDTITASAAGAGYDISGIRPLLDTLSGNA